MRRISIMLPIMVMSAACSDALPTGPSGPAALQQSGSAPHMTVVMRELNNPRQLTWGSEGGLYVAEAGTAEITGPCATVARGSNCYSGTGSVSRLYRGRQQRLASHLPSVFNPATGEVTGPHDVAGFGNSKMHVSIGWGADPAARAQLGKLAYGFGSLIELFPRGGWRVVADVSAFETANNPAGGPFDSNPYGALATRSGYFVADAGGNSLVFVNKSGQISLEGTFPSFPAPPPFMQSEAVPTEVNFGPDGSLYVSTLTGVPFVTGAAGIYRVRDNQPPQLIAGGFKAITDFAVGPDGSLYVLQFASSPLFLDPPGSLVRVAPDGTRTVITSSLMFPTGILLGEQGEIYVSNRGLDVGTGEVLRISE